MYFKQTLVHPNIWMIQEPWYTEHANMFLVVGSARTMLIDTGTGIGNISQWLLTQGVIPDVVLTTHVHFDHCGGLFQFHPEQVYLTALQERNIVHPTLWGMKYFQPQHVTDELRDLLYSYTPTPPVGSRRLGQRIDIGDYQFKVLSFPGHTNDSILLYEPTQHWMFTGDALYNGELYVDFPNADARVWKRRMGQLATIALSVVFPGHNRILRGLDIDKAIYTSILV